MKELNVPISMFHHIKDNGANGFYNDMNHCISYAEFGWILEEFSKQEFAQKISAPLFSPTVYKLIKGQIGTNGKRCAGYRNKRNATLCGIMFLDSDNGLSFDEAVAKLWGLECFVYTTGNNGKNGPNDHRVRVVVPLTEMVEYETHKAALEGLYGFLKRNKPTWECDEGKLNAYSLFYVPGQYKSAAVNRFLYQPGKIHPASYWIDNFPSPIQHKKATKTGPDLEPVEYTLSGTAPWSPPLTLIADYRRQRDGRYNKLFGLAVSLTMSAINKGFDLTVKDLAEIITEEQRRNPPSSHSHTWSQLIGETIPGAMISARNKVPVPAFVRREQQIEADIAEMREYFETEAEEDLPEP